MMSSFLITKEKAFVRPTFFVENKHIYIPSLFAKISGVSKNDKEYFQRLKAVTSFDNSILVNTFPFTKEQKSKLPISLSRCIRPWGEITS